MRIFFSSLPNKEVIDALIEMECYSFLFSFENMKKCLTQTTYLSTIIDKPIVVIIDSGAFSTWNKGLQISRTDYFYFIKRLQESGFPHKIYFMNLDVIPHVKGTKPTKEQLEVACEKGIENYQWFRDRGVETVHTFHHFEDYKYLDIIIKECNSLNLIAVSPANDTSMEDRFRFLRESFSIIQQRTRVHLLGFSAKEGLEMVPAYSCDSSTWLNPGKYGETFDYKQMRKIAKHALTAHDLLYYRQNGAVINAFRYFSHLQEYVTKLWLARNITWKD